MDVEIVTIGYEILDGDVLDTNSNWMAKRISETGHKLRRITLIEDDVGIISQTIQDCLSRSPGMVIVSGGLGPTKDDLTLEGVARALGVGLAENEDAMVMIANRYAEWNPGETLEELLTEPRRKMGIIPIGSTPLENPVGTAPGVLFEKESTTLICLPGVPRELKGLFTETVLPLLGVEVPDERCSVVVRGMGESELATYLNQVMKEADVEIRSYPSRRKIRLKILGPNYPAAIDALERLLAEKATVGPDEDESSAKKD